MWTRKDGVTFFCKAEGYGSGSLRDKMIKEDATTELKFTLGVADQFVAGTVVDAEGRPAAGVSVYASGTGQPGNARAITDAKGRFRIENLVAGKVHVRAYHKTEGSTREARKWANANDMGVRLQLPEASGEVTGMVVDAAGRPVPMAKVESYVRGRKITTDKDGKFKIIGLVQGWFTVDVQSVNEKGELLKRSLRLKPGMKDAKITLPAKNKEEPALPVDPVDLTGKPAAEVKIATWVNCEPLPAHGRGNVRILDFWGLECAPCIASFPKVQQFWEAHRGKGIEFLATTSFYPVEEVKEFLAKHPSYTFPVALRGDDSSADLDYDVRGVPTYVVIDAFGKIASTGHDFEEAAKVALELVGK
jgi:thiol-disulfide isomerase/thioredoxin